jgi:hypothetical protein
MSESLPETVRIREVGPRDGFQNEPEVLPTAEKLRPISGLNALAEAMQRKLAEAEGQAG